MGERCNTLFQAFDGWTLDWNSVFGSGFKSVPKGWRSVYHECHLEDLVRIARDGLSSLPQELQHPELRKEMALIDRYRPAHIIKQGISRTEAISAAPSLSRVRYMGSGVDGAVLEMKVDPKRCYVVDADHILTILPIIGRKSGTSEKYRGVFRQYWNSAVPLDGFDNNYTRIETNDGPHWVAKRNASAGLPRTFFSPEVLVMKKIIPKRYLRIVRLEPAYVTEEASIWDDPEEIKGEG